MLLIDVKLSFLIVFLEVRGADDSVLHQHMFMGAIAFNRQVGANLGTLVNVVRELSREFLDLQNGHFDSSQGFISSEGFFVECDILVDGWEIVLLYDVTVWSVSFHHFAEVYGGLSLRLKQIL